MAANLRRKTGTYFNKFLEAFLTTRGPCFAPIVLNNYFSYILLAPSRLEEPWGKQDLLRSEPKLNSGHLRLPPDLFWCTLKNSKQKTLKK